MHVKSNLSILTMFALTQSAMVGCAERECTEAEAEAAGADGNDDCTRFVPFVSFNEKEKHSSRRDWEMGDDVLITGDIRSVHVIEGESEDEVRVVWNGQVDLAQGRERSVVDATLEHLTTSMTKSSAGKITFTADRKDSDADLGAAIVLELPAGFDGDLVIDKRNRRSGDVEIDFLGRAVSLEVDMNALGDDLELGGVSRLRTAIVNVDGDITMTGAFGSSLRAAVLHSSFGDIQARFDAPPESHARLVTDFGDVAVRVPADGDFTLAAVAERAVTFDGVPSACRTRDDSAASKAMICGEGDPAGLTFDLESDGEIDVTF
jgi:hypothetical protein